MRAYVISIGSELMAGHLTDTNATYLAQELAANGIELTQVVQVGDNLERLTRVLRLAIEDADLVVCTGGIGPTDDDLTREAIAALAGETPVVDEEIVAGIRDFFARRGLEMPARNAKQAWVIPSAEVLPNPVGTAPGWFADVDGTLIVAMPGVPREMVRMWREQALPRIASRLSGRVYRSANLRTLGIGESAVAELLGELTRQANPEVGTYAKDDGVHVRITAAADEAATAETLLQESLEAVRSRLGDYVYADDERSLAQVLIGTLREQQRTLGIAEAGTGGRFGSLMLSEPCATGVVLGASAAPLGSSKSAGELAAMAKERAGSEMGVGIAASLQPASDGLFEGVIAVAVSGCDSTEQTFPIRATFGEIQRRAALHAADVLRRTLGKF